MIRLPTSERRRRAFGLVLFVCSVALGGVCLTSLFLLPPLFSPNAVDQYLEMLVGLSLALPAGIVYLVVTRLLDRFDPEPWFALGGAVLWGGIAACGFSALVNTSAGALVTGVLGSEAGTFASTVLSAPLVEEFFKGLGVLGIAYFLKREFDGVVDGVIYASFIGLGFAAIENVVYYAQAASGGMSSLAATFFVRGVLSPWVHPLYTSMFGLGLGVARETRNELLRYVAPLIGYIVGVVLHAIWNLSASVEGGLLFIMLLPLWFVFVLLFLVTVIVLVIRRGHIIRNHLRDEVAIGTIDEEMMRYACTPFGFWRARMRFGKKGGELVRAVARLALSKWHTSRAVRNDKHTVSAGFIVPLRKRIEVLRLYTENKEAVRAKQAKQA